MAYMTDDTQKETGHVSNEINLGENKEALRRTLYTIA